MPRVPGGLSGLLSLGPRAGPISPEGKSEAPEVGCEPERAAPVAAAVGSQAGATDEKRVG